MFDINIINLIDCCIASSPNNYIFKLLNNEANICIESSKFNYFHDIIINNFLNNYDNIMEIIEKEMSSYKIVNQMTSYNMADQMNKSSYISTSVYSMRILVDYNNLINLLSF